jgi:adenosine deaminase
MKHQLRRTLFHLPKVDLHRHLEGSIRPNTVLEIAEENNVKLLSCNIKKLASLFSVRTPTSLRQFLKPLLLVQQCFYNEKAIQRITYEVVEDASKDNVKYLKLSFGPAFIAGAHKLSLDEVFKGVISGVKKGQKELSD